MRAAREHMLWWSHENHCPRHIRSGARGEGSRFPDAQAEAVRRIARKAQEIEFSALATKDDLAVTRADLQRDLAELKAQLQRDLAELKAELQRDLAKTRAKLLTWIIGSIGIQTIVLLGAMVALTRTMPH
jgi:hypothetical protein